MKGADDILLYRHFFLDGLFTHLFQRMESKVPGHPIFVITSPYSLNALRLRLTHMKHV
jgi:hypothetical protein